MDKQKMIIIGASLFGVLFVVIALSLFFSGGFSQKSNLFQQQPIDRNQARTKTTSGKGYSLQGALSNLVGAGQGNQMTNKKDVFTPEYAREIARKTLEWLDKTRIYKSRLENPSETGEFVSDGGYAAAETCTNKGVCSTRLVGNNVGLIATWAHYKYYEQVKRDVSIMKVIDSDLNTYANTKKISAIQPAIWNVKLMYEMWSGQELNAPQKKLVRDVMYRMQHDPVIIDPIDKEVHDLVDIPEILTLDTATGNSTKPMTEKDNFYSIFSSEYAYSYLFVRDSKAEKEQPYLNTSIALYNEAMKRYIASNGNSVLFNPYLLGVAALDLYRVTGTGTFLDTATRVADRHLNDDCGNDMTICSLRVYFYHELLKVNTKQEYLQARNSLLQKVLSQSYDAREVNGYKIGKNAFYSERKELDESLLYELVPNALFVRVLIEL